MIERIIFRSGTYYGETAFEKMQKWSKDMDREDIISIHVDRDGSIEVFYWKS